MKIGEDEDVGIAGNLAVHCTFFLGSSREQGDIKRKRSFNYAVFDLSVILHPGKLVRFDRDRHLRVDGLCATHNCSLGIFNAACSCNISRILDDALLFLKCRIRDKSNIRQEQDPVNLGHFNNTYV